MVHYDRLVPYTWLTRCLLVRFLVTKTADKFQRDMGFGMY